MSQASTALLLMLCAALASAQSTHASLAGRVTDPSAASIAGARVAAIDIESAVRHETTTGETGDYRLTNLPPGLYRLEVEKPGFRTLIKPDVMLRLQDALVVDLEMTLGDLAIHRGRSGRDVPLADSGSGAFSTMIERSLAAPWYLVLFAGLVLAAVWAAHRIRLRIVETHEQEISALNERLMKAQEQERMRIAGELHDGVAQEMLALTMMLGTARRRIPEGSDAQATLDRIQQKLIQVGTDIRQISHDLHPPMLQEAGLPEAVRAYCDQFAASSGIAVSCAADDNVRALSPGSALALFRIMQEALGNAAKHAAATQITVRLTRDRRVVYLTVSDNGVGFERGRAGTGLGLISMRERAGQLNGLFDFDSLPGRGTRIRVEIPFR